MGVQRSRIGTITLAIGLISLGLAWLITNVTRYDVLAQVIRFWPAILVIFGIELLVKNERARRAGEDPPGLDVASVFLLIIMMCAIGVIGYFRLSPFDWGGEGLRILPFRFGWEHGLTERATEHFERILHADAGVERVSIVNLSGDVRVIPAPGKEVKVSAEIEGSAANLRLAQQAIEETSIVTTTEGSTIKIRVSGPASGHNGRSSVARDRRVKVDFQVSVPPGLRVDVDNTFGSVSFQGTGEGIYVRNSYGPVTVEDSNGPVDIRNSFGNVVLSNIEGSARIENRSGEIRVDGVREAWVENQFGAIKVTDVNGRLDVRNSSGDIEVHKVAGYIKITNAFGAVSVEDPGSGIEIRNSTGNIRVNVMRPIKEDCLLSTRFGAIELSLPPGTNASINARTRLGSIHADSSITVEKETTEQRATGKLGKGGPQVILEATNGDITIRTGGPGDGLVLAPGFNGS